MQFNKSNYIITCLGLKTLSLDLGTCQSWFGTWVQRDLLVTSKTMTWSHLWVATGNTKESRADDDYRSLTDWWKKRSVALCLKSWARQGPMLSKLCPKLTRTQLSLRYFNLNTITAWHFSLQASLYAPNKSFSDRDKTCRELEMSTTKQNEWINK